MLAPVVVAGNRSLLRQSVSPALGTLPACVDPGAVPRRLRMLPGVADKHDRHDPPIRAMSTAAAAPEAPEPRPR